MYTSTTLRPWLSGGRPFVRTGFRQSSPFRKARDDDSFTHPSGVVDGGCRSVHVRTADAPILLRHRKVETKGAILYGHEDGDDHLWSATGRPSGPGCSSSPGCRADVLRTPRLLRGDLSASRPNVRSDGCPTRRRARSGPELPGTSRAALDAEFGPVYPSGGGPAIGGPASVWPAVMP
jgi:hypothetical protein